MSISLEFENNIFKLNKLQLPSRYYYFNDEQNYIKLLSIGEGIFPKDRIKTYIKLQDSDSIVATESAAKIYPSSKEYGINAVNIELKNSNLEFLNDELILYKDAKLLQFLKIKADESSTFFYGDILSDGRSNENFDFTSMRVKNSFYCDNEIEYLEKFDVVGDELKKYTKDMATLSDLFAKVYIKTKDNEQFLNTLKESKFLSFSYTSNQKMIIGVVSDNNMGNLKKKVKSIWSIYREFLDKKEFNLGKQ